MFCNLIVFALCLFSFNYILLLLRCRRDFAQVLLSLKMFEARFPQTALVSRLASILHLQCFLLFQGLFTPLLVHRFSFCQSGKVLQNFFISFFTFPSVSACVTHIGTLSPMNVALALHVLPVYLGIYSYQVWMRFKHSFIKVMNIRLHNGCKENGY